MVEGIHSILMLFKSTAAKQFKTVLLTRIMMLTSGQAGDVVAHAKTVINIGKIITEKLFILSQSDLV